MKMMAVREQREMSSEDESQVSGDLRRGPWSVEEDLLLVNYIAAHGEGQWNALARCAGLKRTGKSCRLRWLNYLRPDLRRGNFTAQEQLLILELHSRWGNRWSRIAQHLPGRTDNEIKNYWRTRVQKHARQLNCDVNSQQFRDLVRYLWIPRLLERMHLSGSSSPPDVTPPSQLQQFHHFNEVELSYTTAASSSSSVSTDGMQQQPPLVSQPEMVSAAEGSYWSTCTDNDNNKNDSMKKSSMSLCADTWCQPPNASTTECYNPAQYLGASETCWSSVVPADPFSTGVYAADMAPFLPDLGETMWGADDLWYTQIMGL